MDVAILAGGYGTRLKGVWNRPKCLVPYQGRPLIEHLVERSMELKPRKVFLLLGYKASEVVAWREGCYPHRDVIPIIETVPEGTASAIRNALPWIICPLLVLNGDTLPLYNLSLLKEYFNDLTGSTVAAWTVCYAGACMFGAHGKDSITFSNKKDLNDFILPAALRLPITGFIDMGTPEGLKQAWRHAAGNAR